MNDEEWLSEILHNLLDYAEIVENIASKVVLSEEEKTSLEIITWVTEGMYFNLKEGGEDENLK